MAKECVDGEFWLPSEILCDDFFLGGGPGAKGGEASKVGFGESCFPSEFPFGFGSNLDSPVESVTETEETEESDEDEDYMAGLTQQMAHYFLQDDEKDASVPVKDNSKAMARSPQSTLSAWSAVSNKGSPNGPSLVSSPPSSSPLEQLNKAEPRDLLYEAAGQVMRMRLNDFGLQESLYDRGILGAPKKPSPTVAAAPKNGNAGSHTPNPVLTHQQIQAAHFYHLRRQQTMKQQVSAALGRPSNTRAGAGSYSEGRLDRPLDLSPSAWPPLRKTPPAQQQQPPPLPGTGMRAVFLHGAGVRKESAGTGVFLPRTAGNKLEPRKKTGCSTVLVPDRVVQALNLNLDEFAAQPRFPGGFVLSHDALIGRSSAVQSHHKKYHHINLPTQPPAASATAAAVAHDMGLPQEWTY
ncbi:hypothetical protein Cni_G23751 [Canna indica]|uniref:Uncharacterized protein n=1 Tax=Canna indica TaxID=4628 RepID=A0AAQ3QNW5_9LILI|nr:hypothetical protein Cni_G23751 [Canna indica]